MSGVTVSELYVELIILYFYGIATLYFCKVTMNKNEELGGKEKAMYRGPVHQRKFRGSRFRQELRTI